MFQDRILIIEQDNQSWINYIKSVQTKLKELYPGINLGNSGPNKDGVDGVLGKLTRMAVRKFQLENGGNGKGFPGEWTASKLGLKYVPKPDVLINKDTEQTTQQNCKKFEIFPPLNDTRDKICKGQKTRIQKGPDGCSEYVREKTGAWQGNAWHAYKLKGYPTLSGFKSVFRNPSNLDTMAKIFQKINSQSSGISASGIKSDGTFGMIKSLMGSSIPSQSSFKNLNVGDVVGIYYPSSRHHGEAFFQGATGMSSDGTKVTAGPYFIVDENGKTRPWQPSDIGKNVKIKPGKSLLQGDHFGFNTHLGFVGAKKPNGEPIIYHNVSGNVMATPLSDMGNEFSIIWGRPA